MGFGDFGEKSFTVMAERGMSDIMRKSNCFNKILVESEKTPHCPGYLGDQLNVEDAMSDMIIFDEIEDLGFVDVSRICQGVQDSIRVQ
jgi:hypothetical protein